MGSEAKKKANEIRMKGEEEFNNEVHKLVTEEKEKLRQGFDRRVKQVETQYAIAKSLAINKQRLDKIKARQEVMTNIAQDARTKLVQDMKNADQSKNFISELILQGLLMLLESEVTVRCRECDVKLVEGCLPKAQEMYEKSIRDGTGATRKCNLSIDKKEYLHPPPQAGSESPSCLGGVVLMCQGGKICIDNTIDLRLQLVMEQDRPAIRKMLFPTN